MNIVSGLNISELLRDLLRPLPANRLEILDDGRKIDAQALGLGQRLGAERGNGARAFRKGFQGCQSGLWGRLRCLGIDSPVMRPLGQLMAKSELHSPRQLFVPGVVRTIAHCAARLVLLADQDVKM